MLIRYEDWSRRTRGATRSSHPIGATAGITAHWEGPHMGAFPHDRCADKVRQIQAFHRDTRGWADIAYNALVCPHGDVFEGRGPGVRSAANGNTQANDTHYAVCYLGGEGDPFTDAGRAGFLEAFDWLTREGAAGPERNGHRDHKATACPGDDIYQWVHSPAARQSEEDDMTPDQAKKLDDIHGRLFGVTKQRYVVEGETRRPAHLLDELDGNYLVRQIAAAKVNVDELAARVAVALPDSTASAAEIAAELIRQLATPQES